MLALKPLPLPVLASGTDAGGRRQGLQPLTARHLALVLAQMQLPLAGLLSLQAHFQLPLLRRGQVLLSSLVALLRAF